MTSTSARIRNSRKRKSPRDPSGREPSRTGTGAAGARHSLVDMLRYRFDNLLSRGTLALILLLSIISALIIFIAALVVTITGIAPGGSGGFLGLLYKSLLHAIDTGTVAGDSGNPWFLFFMLMVTIGGIFIVSALIGVITTGMDRKMDELRRGRSVVLERGHTLVLGWSPQVFTIISELVTANENQPRSCVVVLGPEDKVTMEDEIHARVPDTGKTRLVCRSGSPIDPADLRIGSPHTARSIIILPPETDDPDTQVIKTLLALTNDADRPEGGYHIVTQIRNPDNLAVARMVGRDEAQLILGSDLIARITVQTCRQSGLSAVYNELLDFDGDEIYFQEERGLVGRTFKEALSAYETSSIIGIHDASGTRLLPPLDYRLQAGDRVIAISEDDDTIRLSEHNGHVVDTGAISGVTPPAERPERTLVLGWNRSGGTIVRELDNYVPPNSETVVVSREGGEPGLPPGLSRQTVSFREGDTTSRSLLDSLDIPSFDHVIVLSYSDELDPQESDSHTLVTLLHLRDIQEHSEGDFSIVSEMRDVRNRELAEVTRADDFIVSDQLLSLLMTQISENKHLAAVFDDLFDADGAEIYLKSAEIYVAPGSDIDFYTVVEAAANRSEIAIGYRKHGRNGNRGHVVVNPPKSDRIVLDANDRVIVLAQD